MESTLKAWQNSPYAWALLALITVISLILAVYFGVKSNKYQRITYAKKTNKLVSLKNSAVKSLHLFYDKEEIMDASITRIVVWNSGNERIDSTDVVESEPLRVCIRDGFQKDTRILDCSITHITDKNIFYKHDPSKFKANGNTYELPFDYLPSEEGMIIQVIHTGESEGIAVDCSIKGGKRIIELEANSDGVFRTKININSVPVMRKLPHFIKKRFVNHERVTEHTVLNFFYFIVNFQ